MSFLDKILLVLQIWLKKALNKLNKQYSIRFLTQQPSNLRLFLQITSDKLKIFFNQKNN